MCMHAVVKQQPRTHTQAAQAAQYCSVQQLGAAVAVSVMTQAPVYPIRMCTGCSTSKRFRLAKYNS